MSKISFINFHEVHNESKLSPDFWVYERNFADNGKWVMLGDVLTSVQYGLSLAMNLSRGIPIYRMNEMDNLFLAKANKFVEISESQLNQFSLKYNDVLFNRTNSFEFVGRTGIYKRSDVAVFASYLIRLETDTNKLLPEYLTAFLNTKPGIDLVKRRAKKSINQANVSGSELKKIPIFLATLHFQSRLKKLLDDSFEKIKNSEFLYSQAKDILSNALCKNNDQVNAKFWTPTFSNFKNTKRLDPEFWHPQHYQTQTILKTQNLGSLVLCKKGIEVGSSEYCAKGYKFIRVSDITIHGIEGTDTKFISKNLFESLKMQHKPSIGEILLTKDASPGIAALLEEEIDYIISSGVLRLSLKADINPYYLEFLLNSEFVKKQIERYCAGSVIIHWKPSQIENTDIPRLPENKENEIAGLVQKSHKLRRESKRLLGVTIKAVEIAIEESEEKAMVYLNENQPV